MSVKVYDKEEVRNEIERARNIISGTQTFRNKTSALSPDHEVYDISAVVNEFDVERQTNYAEASTRRKSVKIKF